VARNWVEHSVLKQVSLGNIFWDAGTGRGSVLKLASKVGGGLRWGGFCRGCLRKSLDVGRLGDRLWGGWREGRFVLA